MPPEVWLGGAMVAALVLYLLSGGADFGGGVWDLLASGPRRAEQRALIEHAIGPIWEANHVWLILVVVVLFTAFPPAFAALSVALHIPLTLLLLGIVFRGASFAFRSFLPGPRRTIWGSAFAVASLIAPLLLGVVVGAIASGRITVPPTDFVSPWLAPFPFAVGGLTLALCAFLAAVYLCHEASDPALADDFRRRALLAGAATIAIGALTLLLAGSGAPHIRDGMFGRVLLVAGPIAFLLSAAATVALLERRFALARILAASLAALVVVGWAAAQYPYLIVDDLTLHEAAASPRTLHLLLVVLALGVPVLLPCLFFLFQVFKRTDRA
jgi:cytochrome d ubiquinol oxidase subunit II